MDPDAATTRTSGAVAAPPGAARAYFIMAGLAFLVGAFLRFYLLRDQVLVDDEWHSMAFVVGKSFAWLLTNFAVPNGYTSIPLNLYQALLLETAGWSEGWLRLPSIVFGLLCLVSGPVLARPLVGSRRAGLLALLLAVSPLLVFYSRLARPYSAVAAFSFAGLFFVERWMRTGAPVHGMAFALCATAAVYCHLFAIVSVAAMAGVALFFCLPWKRRMSSGLRGAPSARQALAVLSGMGLACVVLMLPAFVNSLRMSFFDVAMQGSIPLASWLRFAVLVAGTENPLLAALFWGLLAVGVFDLGRRHARFAVLLVALFPVQVLAMLLARPHSCHVGIVLARYGITLVPVSLLLVSCGLHACLEAVAGRRPPAVALPALLSCAFAAALYGAGPLPGIDVAPNNFTNHGAFQHRYGRMDWSRSFRSEFAPPDFPLETSIRAGELSDFYRALRASPNGRPIVEYPMPIGDHFNPLYYYQRLHRRPVLVGYALDIGAARPLVGGGVYGNLCIDEVLNLVETPAALRFRNLVEMGDVAGLRARGVEYVVIHKRFEAQLWQVVRQPPAFRAVMEEYRASFRLVHEDDAMVVFSLEG